MKVRYFIFIALAAGLLSCTKLDEKVYDKIPGDMYPESPEQIAALSVVTYQKLQNMADDGNDADGGWWFLSQEISADGLAAPTRGNDWLDGGKWQVMHRHTWAKVSPDLEGINRMWLLFWTGITTCNQQLDLMNAIPPSPTLDAKKKEVIVVRAFYYYLLIDNFGDAPYLTSSANAPPLPYKKTRSDIYDSLVKDITAALPALKMIDKKYMMTRYSAFALLAKLYLNGPVYKNITDAATQATYWQKASDYCDSVMTGPYSLATNVSDPFKTANENSGEIIFSIPYDEDNFQGFRLHMRTLHYQMNLVFNMPVGPWNGFAINPQFWATYQSTDKRREAYNIWGQQYTPTGVKIQDGETHQDLNINPLLPALDMQPPTYTPYELRTSGARVGKYQIKMGAKENLSNDFPLFRITDFYLMKAEAEIRLGNNGDQWINPIRLRAGVAAWNNAGLDSLLAERGRELYCEGHRRQDLIRYGRWEQSWWEKNAHGPDMRVFPIPKWATDANSHLLEPPQ
jgi:starch-binding outer membrane protein, SusD/RagB family